MCFSGCISVRSTLESTPGSIFDRSCTLLVRRSRVGSSVKVETLEGSTQGSSTSSLFDRNDRGRT